MSVRIFKIAELVRVIRDRARSNDVISLDGISGSGKSTVAIFLEQELGAKLVRIDYFLKGREEGRKGYKEHINFKKLEEDIRKLMSDHKIIFVEGVMILEIFEKINIKPCLDIYVKPKKNSPRFSFLQNILSKSSDQIFFRLDAPRMKGPQANVLLDKQLIEYHKNYKPVDKADFVYENCDELEKAHDANELEQKRGS